MNDQAGVRLDHILADRELLVDPERGYVSRRLFSDERLYELELERIFHRCWLFVGHETMVPEPGSYLSNYMGEDPIILWRDSSSKLHVFLNSCTHRGNKLCMFDSGCAQTFTCSYHGWSFDSEGQLTGVPFFEQAYEGELPKERFGLLEAARLQSYGGLLFASWNPDVEPLDQFLG